MQFKTLGFKLSEKADLAKGEFAAYASTWKNVDSYGDIIQEGAFTRSLPKFLECGLIFWQHNTRVPIGKPVPFDQAATATECHRIRGGLRLTEVQTRQVGFPSVWRWMGSTRDSSGRGWFAV